jgi:hypothetical protein
MHCSPITTVVHRLMSELPDKDELEIKKHLDDLQVRVLHAGASQTRSTSQALPYISQADVMTCQPIHRH